MADPSRILVSIGVPVFNGERGIARALDSLLAQDHRELEIIISDNGSTDATQAICETYVKKDPRVKYYRGSVNRGAVWNFNRVFELSTGKYFMWAAHDDEREPTFVSACVAKLEECPTAVLCQVHTSFYVEGHDELLCVADLETLEGLTGLVDRYRETLQTVPATVIYGLYRSSAMRKTHLLQQSIASDIAFIQELSLYGDFVQVPKLLFSYIGREKWNTVHQDYKAFFGKERKPWWYLPFVALFVNHSQRLADAPLPLLTKVRLWTALVEYEAGRLSVRALVKATGRVCPEGWKDAVGSKIYWRWMHSPNVKAGDMNLYLKRVIRPRLGWWQD